MKRGWLESSILLGSAVLVLGTSFAKADGFVPDWANLSAIVGHAQSAVTPTRHSLQSHAILNWEARPTLAPDLEFRTSGWAGGFLKTPAKSVSHLRGEVREASLQYSYSGLETEAGQLFLPWGKADGVNPTDYLTAKDYTLYSPDDLRRKKGAPGARLKWTPMSGTAPVSFDAVFIARNARSTLLLPADRVPSYLTFSPEASSDPDTEVALRTTYSGESWDGSVSLFRGSNHFPQYVLNGTRIEPRYFRRTAVGADFSRSFQNWIVRGEAAYSMQDSLSKGRTEGDHVDGVIGVERGFEDRYRILIQGLYRRYTNWENPGQDYLGTSVLDQTANVGLARLNALLVNYQNRGNPGLTMLFSYHDEADRFRASVNLIGNFIGRDFLIRPEVSHSFFEGHRLTLGADLYGGPRERPLGALRDFSTLFAEWKVFL